MLQLNFKKFETIQLHGIAENPTRRSKSPNKKHKKFRTKNDKINKQKARRISKTRIYRSCRLLRRGTPRHLSQVSNNQTRRPL